MKELIAADSPAQEPCQYAADVGMPEYRCAIKCQYADTTMREELNFATGALERQSERIALLEGLLRETLPNEHGNPEWRERIRAALGVEL